MFVIAVNIVNVDHFTVKWGIKFRPIKPRSPYLNGKVQRTQRTDLEEFYALEDICDPNLSEKLPNERFRLPNYQEDLKVGNLK